jgi:hypothetical protein
MGKLNVSMLRYLTREDFRSVLPNFCRFHFDIVPVSIQLVLDIFDTVIMFLRIFGFTFQQSLMA